MNKKYSECLQFLKTAHRTNLCNGTRLQKQKVVPHQLYIYIYLVHLIQEFAFLLLVYFNHSSRITKIKNKILYLSHDFEEKKLGQMARTNKVVKFEPEMSQLCLLLVSSNQGFEQAL